MDHTSAIDRLTGEYVTAFPAEAVSACLQDPALRLTEAPWIETYSHRWWSGSHGSDREQRPRWREP